VVGGGRGGCCLKEEALDERVEEEGTSLNYQIIYMLLIYIKSGAHRPCLVLFGSNTS
jgi:hypothetical protein